MTCETFSQGRSAIHRLDPRGRVLAAVVFAVLIAVSRRFGVLGAGLALAVISVGVARLPVVPALRRLRALNLFLLLFWLVVPLTTPGEAVLALGPLQWSLPGVLLAARLTLKANAIVLMLTVLVGTVETPTLGHALHHLRVPEKLVHLLLFTVRYIDLIHHEYRRLRAAMRVRCFRPRMNAHTYRTFGNLVGMLLVRSFDRAERVVAAMKCRGFSGRFFLLTHFAFERRDALFAAASLAALVLLGLGEWA